MSGTFSSEAQALRDSQYYHIKLSMTPLWKERTDGYWLYVEQAMAQMEDRPYRQRIYHLYIQDDTTIVSKVYEMLNPEKYLGASKMTDLLKPLTREMLVDRQGCAIYLKKRKKVYYGSTPGKECISSLKGAVYATSEVTIFKDKLISWDRGWNEKDVQVWGAVKGGYAFQKL
ncbi:MAG: chromophore lyase CpcT/CpeT [Saprospiraceae bacterium]|nr:chromophore lyase CpcT/CpeT [Saprospiraceae bacterium]